MAELSFKIRGLDCAEEVATLKRAIGPLVGGDERLGFDVLQGKMMIDGVSASAEGIIAAVGATGMAATPWDDYVAARARGDAEPFWTRRGRSLLCAVSGLSIVSSTLLHGFQHGGADAFGNHGEPHSYPALVVLLYIVAIIAGAWFVVPKAWYAIRQLRPDMNFLMSVAVMGAIVLGEWMEAAAVSFLFSLALLLETWSVGRARRAIKSLLDLSPDVAHVRCCSSEEPETRPVDDVAIGATIVVKPSERIPLDGIVSGGHSSVDEAAITGESMPVEKSADDTVYAGTINGDASLEIEVTKLAGDTTLAKIIHLVENAQSRRAPSEQWVERFARIYTPTMMVLALAVAVVPPLFTGAWSEWFYQALVILVIACPCALVISTPVSIVAGLASAARAGVLIKGGAYLEAPAGLRAIAFDKTGTVTRGKPVVQKIVPLNGHSEGELLERAASLEAQSNHPLARAIREAADSSDVTYGAAQDYQIIQGKGAQGDYDGRTFWIGSHRFLHEKVAETPECESAANAMEDAGHSVVVIGNETHVCGLISVADEVRADSAEVVRDLRAAGIQHIAMLSGDNRRTAEAVAALIGVDAVESEVLPEEKVAAVERIGKEFGKVAMVGDGVNDAPAMAASDLGIAMGAAGSDAAIETADIALMSDDLSKVPWLIRHSRRTLAIIKQNIAFALGLKLAFIVLAFFGLATLWMAIAADMGASLLVIANGLRLLRAT